MGDGNKAPVLLVLLTDFTMLAFGDIKSSILVFLSMFRSLGLRDNGVSDIRLLGLNVLISAAALRNISSAAGFCYWVAKIGWWGVLFEFNLSGGNVTTRWWRRGLCGDTCGVSCGDVCGDFSAFGGVRFYARFAASSFSSVTLILSTSIFAFSYLQVSLFYCNSNK